MANKRMAKKAAKKAAEAKKAVPVKNVEVKKIEIQPIKEAEVVETVEVKAEEVVVEAATEVKAEEVVTTVENPVVEKADTVEKEENVEALKKGIDNLGKHIDTIKHFGINTVIAINKFDTDSIAEIEFIKQWAKERNIPISLSEVFAKGGEGGIDLAHKVVDAISDDKKYTPLYELSDPIHEKILKIAQKAYGAKDVIYAPGIKEKIDGYMKSEFKDYYICMAKTPNSLTDNQKIIGAPKDFPIHIRDIRVSTGAKFIICLTGDVMTMPGLSKEPMALKIDIDGLKPTGGYVGIKSCKINDIHDICIDNMFVNIEDDEYVISKFPDKKFVCEK